MHLIGPKKIILASLLLLAVTYNPGAIEKTEGLPDKIVPGNIRLSNSLSSSDDFLQCDAIVESFLHKWSIAGASVAIAKDGRLVYAKGYGYADTSN